MKSIWVEFSGHANLMDAPNIALRNYGFKIFINISKVHKALNGRN